MRHIADNYAYFDQKSVVWSSVPTLYAAERERVRTRRDLVVLLERVVDELYDHHAHLTTNTPESTRLVPSGADMWAVWQNRRATVVEVRADYDASGRRSEPRRHRVDRWMPIAKALQARSRSLGPPTMPLDLGASGVAAGRRNERGGDWSLAQREATVELPAREQIYPRSGRWRLCPNGKAVHSGHDTPRDRIIGDFDNALEKLSNTSASRDCAIIRRGQQNSGARNSRSICRPRVPYQKLPESAARETGVARSWPSGHPARPLSVPASSRRLVNQTGSMGGALP